MRRVEQCLGCNGITYKPKYRRGVDPYHEKCYPYERCSVCNSKVRPFKSTKKEHPGTKAKAKANPILCSGCATAKIADVDYETYVIAYNRILRLRGAEDAAFFAEMMGSPTEPKAPNKTRFERDAIHAGPDCVLSKSGSTARRDWEERTGTKIPEGKVLSRTCGYHYCISEDHVQVRDRSVLTDEDKQYIKNSNKRGAELSKEFGVAQSTISRVRRGR